MNDNTEVTMITPEMRSSAPSKLNWATQGATTPVKDQGSCGSCWAFSATEGVESGIFMSTGTLPPALSTQQLISCDKNDGGCDGGDITSAFSYLKSEGGMSSASSYPDTSHKNNKDGSCKSHKNVAVVDSYKYGVSPCKSGSCNNQDEDGLKAALHTHGPMSICVNANDWDNSYTGGLYTKTCSSNYNSIDHCVQLVGYDTTASTPYWIVRNSWSADWGANGFIYLPMGHNACSVASEAMYVTGHLGSSPGPSPTPAPSPSPHGRRRSPSPSPSPSPHHDRRRRSSPSPYYYYYNSATAGVVV